MLEWERGLGFDFEVYVLLSYMESYLNDNFGDVKPKNSSEEALQRWRKLCWVVKNPKRRFRFTANLSKRFEAQAIRRSNQVIFPLLSMFVCLFLFFFWKEEVNLDSAFFPLILRLGILKSTVLFYFIYEDWECLLCLVLVFYLLFSFSYCCWNCECCELPGAFLTTCFWLKMLNYDCMATYQIDFLIISIFSHSALII